MPTLLLALWSALVLVQSADPLASRSKGAADAPVTVYEMADFQCPACRSFALNIFPVIDREYIATGKVRWVFINLPLTSIHPNAVEAAEVAMCAAQQGSERFWKAHDLLYEHQKEWERLADPRAALVALAERAGADRTKLLACLRSGAARAEVEADARRAERAGARATPSFYIEGGLLEGSPPNPTGFRLLLDSVYRVRTSRAR
jgi:protein-disulfide isomerase